MARAQEWEYAWPMRFADPSGLAGHPTTAPRLCIDGPMEASLEGWGPPKMHALQPACPSERSLALASCFPKIESHSVCEHDVRKLGNNATGPKINAIWSHCPRGKTGRSDGVNTLVLRNFSRKIFSFFSFPSTSKFGLLRAACFLGRFIIHANSRDGTDAAAVSAQDSRVQIDSFSTACHHGQTSNVFVQARNKQ